jgi:hypothetical protein
VDTWIKRGTALVTIMVAAFAAIVSYWHIYDLGTRNGQFGIAARALPLSIDGLILAASLLMLYFARRMMNAPALAEFMLWLGIAATVLANVAYGIRFGVIGAIISAWPAAAFVGTVEMLMLLVRTMAEDASPATVREPVAAALTVSASAHERTPTRERAPAYARARKSSATSVDHLKHYADELAAGKIPSVRRIIRELHVGQPKAVGIHTELVAHAAQRHGAALASVPAG